MALTITPVVHGGNRRRWGLAVALHTAGATATAALFGAALGAIGDAAGAVPTRPWLSAVALVAAVYAGREVVGLPVPVPAARRQVPEWWRTFFSPNVAAGLYGLGLGIGYVTFLSFGTYVAVTVAAVVSGSPATGAAVVGAFGLTRGLAVLVAWRATTEPRVARLGSTLDRLASSPGVRAANGVALLVVAVAAGASAWRASGGLTPRLLPGALAAVFAWAGLAKVVDPARWRRALAGYRLGAADRALAMAVPLAELAVAALLLSGRHEEGAALALALLAVFSAAVLRARSLQGDRVACGCFGRARTRDYRSLLGRNAALGALATFTLAGRATGPLVDLPPVRADEALPIALTAIATALGMAMLRMAVRALRERGGQAAAGAWQNRQG
jgi:hypothetical protein